MIRHAIAGFCLLVFTWCWQSSLRAQSLSEADQKTIQEKLTHLNTWVERLKGNRDDVRPVADVEVFAKAADWITRHNEFYKPDYVKWTIELLDVGLSRADELSRSRTPWIGRAGSSVFGYYSAVDDSVQPFVVTLPSTYDPKSAQRWPLHVELHGRGDTLNEVSFIHQHEGKKQKADNDFIQLDVFGRTNNAYRWAGEADVLEALSATKRLFRIDDRRVVLRGFSMGGAGSWHLGLHYPSMWCAVGAGAGFCDTNHHLSLTSPLPELHQKLIRIYDAEDYALNAFDVPIIGYGGELDKQIFASQRMNELGTQLGVTIKRLIGPQTEHKWHPESHKEFMAFLAEHSAAGRPCYPAPARIKFITHTLKYNACDWLIVEEQIRPYEASRVEADVDSETDTVNVTTKNVAVLQIMRDVASLVRIDGGKPLPLSQAAGSLLPGVYFEKRDESWVGWDYQQSHKYAAHDNEGDEPGKHHNLQGPIDDAFMQPFVCVRPTGVPWSAAQNDFAKWTLDRFEREFDKWMRGRIPVVNDTQVTDELIETRNLILFGDPGSNAVLSKVVDRLPVKWQKGSVDVHGQTYDSSAHTVALIYPNPLNPNRYVVINSGHTFHEPQFRASNANLYPRLGDIAVLRFQPSKEGYAEDVIYADVFDSRWRLSEQ